MTPDDLFETSLRMVAVGALLVWSLSCLFSDTPRRFRVGAILFCASAVGYAFNEHGPTRALIGGLSAPLWLLSVAGVGWFWLFVRLLFDDDALDARGFAVPAVLTSTGLLGWFGPEPVQPGVWIVHHLIELAVSGHAAWLVVRSWRADLVASRRRLRVGVIMAMTVFVSVLALTQVRTVLAPLEPQPRILIAAVFAVLAMAGAATFLYPRAGLFAADGRIPEVTGTSAFEDAIVARLHARMTDSELWRREGLTVAALAAAVGVPEHRLRSIINHRLGYRNFTRYINDHRISAAKSTLLDPASAGKTVATVAFELGYGSLGPFNRAFRDVAGMTPTEWRRRGLADQVADSEIPPRF